MTPPPRYRVVVYEHHAGHRKIILDTMGTSYIAAIATPDDDHLNVTVADGGPPDDQHNIAHLIADQHGI